MVSRKNSRGTTLLVILQAWILPCHGFAFAPCVLGCGSSAGAGSRLGAARQSSFVARQPRPPQAQAAVSRGKLPSLSMSEEGDIPFDPFGDELTSGADMDGGSARRFEPPEPYRDEHTPGGSRFKELLARAKGQGAPPPPPMSKPRRILPPEGAPDYDDDNQWEEQVIGSPHVPDPPLRQEMPGMDLGPELGMAEGEAGISGGRRFSRMMNQARQNDDREEAGMTPRASPRSPQEVARRAQQAAPVSKEEKERAIREAVDRQQKLMSKARGIDLDDPTLEGAELARKKALSRAQAESQAGGYVPSSSAADDYLNALKADSQRKQKELQAKLRGEPLPPREEPLLSVSEPVTVAADVPPPPQTLPAAEEFQPVRPQKRSQATWSIQNKADAYIASLKGIKVDLPEDNPYLKKERMGEIPPEGRMLVPPAPPQRPLGPKMTYTERLRLAKQAKAAADSGSAAPAAAAAPAASVAAVSSPEKLKPVPEVNAAATPPAPPTPPPRSPPAAAAAASATPTARLLEQEVPGRALLSEDDAKAKMVRVMDLLTEHTKAGLVGEERVEELRSSLSDAREFLRAETYGAPGSGAAVTPLVTPPSPPPGSPTPPPPPPQQQQQQQRLPATRTAPAAPSPPTATATSGQDAETLRRCSALLQAHVHSSLAGEDLQALVEGLTSSLAIVTAQVVAGITAAGGSGSGSNSSRQGTPPPAAPERAAVPDYVGGAQSVGGVLSDMGVAEKPASFMPEEDGGEDGGTAGWTGGSLSEDEKAVATKALGYLLKHRGGKGYGRGRVKGAEAEAMVAALAEVTEILQDEMVEG
eukprot:g7516.t1